MTPLPTPQRGWLFPVVTNGPFEGLWIYGEGASRDVALAEANRQIAVMTERLNVNGELFGIFETAGVPVEHPDRELRIRAATHVIQRDIAERTHLRTDELAERIVDAQTQERSS